MTPGFQERHVPSQSTKATRIGEAAAQAALEAANREGAGEWRTIILVQIRRPPLGEHGAASISAGMMPPHPSVLLHIARAQLDDLEKAISR